MHFETFYSTEFGVEVRTFPDFRLYHFSMLHQISLQHLGLWQDALHVRSVVA
jgi:hypothetical protein